MSCAVRLSGVSFAVFSRLALLAVAAWESAGGVLSSTLQGCYRVLRFGLRRRGNLEALGRDGLILFSFSSLQSVAGDECRAKKEVEESDARTEGGKANQDETYASQPSALPSCLVVAWSWPGRDCPLERLEAQCQSHVWAFRFPLLPIEQI